MVVLFQRYRVLRYVYSKHLVVCINNNFSAVTIMFFYYWYYQTWSYVPPVYKGHVNVPYELGFVNDFMSSYFTAL